MNKKVLVLIAVLLFAGAGVTYQIGQVLTEAQFANIDFEEADFDIEVDRIEKSTGRITAYFDYTTIEQTGEDEYTIVRNQTQAVYGLKAYFICRVIDGNTMQECKQDAKRQLKETIIGRREKERQRLVEMQEELIYSEILPEDITIEDGEVN